MNWTRLLLLWLDIVLSALRKTLHKKMTKVDVISTKEVILTVYACWASSSVAMQQIRACRARVLDPLCFIYPSDPMSPMKYQKIE
jgi:hypothetical protein